MSDAPFFPNPAKPSAPPGVSPYRTPERPAPSPRLSSKPIAVAPPTPSPERAAIASRIEETVTARARRKRSALLQIGVGVVLLAVGVGLTLFFNGRFIFHGAAVAGMLSLMRGTIALVKNALAPQ